ncbi:MAG: type II toxin-antitoxin system RelE/ParE family toxin [Candidatus Thiodiazotropha sp. DIVDIV]
MQIKWLRKALKNLDDEAEFIAQDAPQVAQIAVQRIRQINEAGINPPEMPDTSGLTEQQKFDVYSSIVQTRGDNTAQSDLRNGNSIIVGLRSENSTLENSGQGVYDDRIAVISKEANGTVHVDEFNRVSTEPTAQYDANLANHPDNNFRRSVGEDVTGDGVSDQGRLASPQTIQMYEDTHRNPASAGGTDFALRPTQQAVSQGQGMVQRFTAGSGYIDTSDPAAISDLNRTFKIHSGSRTNTDSAGCTTIHPNDYMRFENSIRSNSAQGTWNYVLTEVSP